MVYLAVKWITFGNKFILFFFHEIRSLELLTLKLARFTLLRHAPTVAVPKIFKQYVYIEWFALLRNVTYRILDRQTPSAAVRARMLLSERLVSDVRRFGAKIYNRTAQLDRTSVNCFKRYSNLPTDFSLQFATSYTYPISWLALTAVRPLNNERFFRERGHFSLFPLITGHSKQRTFFFFEY